ncbi:hypothetical protein ACJIZ3_001854 [Penstemon smallii]|uniref:Uncharacterized protein n=1 Tax=Penstemon smallii TaxID=265156 RepID=A0ABD3U687_9LAMI
MLPHSERAQVATRLLAQNELQNNPNFRIWPWICLKSLMFLHFFIREMHSCSFRSNSSDSGIFAWEFKNWRG